MKKIALLLIFCLLMNFLVACNGDTGDNVPDTPQVVKTTARGFNFYKEFEFDEQNEPDEMWAYLKTWRSEHLPYYFLEFDGNLLCSYFESHGYEYNLSGKYWYDSHYRYIYDKEYITIELVTPPRLPFYSINITLEYTLSTERLNLAMLALEDFDKGRGYMSIRCDEETGDGVYFLGRNTYEHENLKVSVKVYGEYDGELLDLGEEITSDFAFELFLLGLNYR